MYRSVKTSTVYQQSKGTIYIRPLPGVKKEFLHVKPIVNTRFTAKSIKTPVTPPLSKPPTVVNNSKWNSTTEGEYYTNIKPLPGKKQTLESLRKPFRARPMPDFNKTTKLSASVQKTDITWLGVDLPPEEYAYQLKDEVEPHFEEVIEEKIPLPTHQIKFHHHNSSAIGTCFNWNNKTTGTANRKPARRIVKAPFRTEYGK